MMATRTLIPLTDDRGKPLLPPEEMEEPLPGSVVLTNGAFGTAWQRQFRTGWWYSAGAVQPVRWDELVKRRLLVLVYDAGERA